MGINLVRQKNMLAKGLWYVKNSAVYCCFSGFFIMIAHMFFLKPFVLLIVMGIPRLDLFSYRSRFPFDRMSGCFTSGGRRSRSRATSNWWGNVRLIERLAKGFCNHTFGFRRPRQNGRPILKDLRLHQPYSGLIRSNLCLSFGWFTVPGYSNDQKEIRCTFSWAINSINGIE